MNVQNIKMSAKYELLAQFTWVEHNTVKKYFSRNSMSVNNQLDIQKYITSYTVKKLKKGLDLLNI